MSASEIDMAVIQQLQTAVDKKDRYSILLGAGASVGAGLPDWNALLLKLLDQSGAITDAETAAAFLANQDPALAAEAAKKSASNWTDVLLEGLYGDAPAYIRPSALHLAAATVALTSKPVEVDLFTLNFDLLIEQALSEVAIALGMTASTFTRTASSPRAKNGVYEVHHLHGALDRDKGTAENVVLTLSEFNELVGAAHPWQVAALSNALGYGPLILAGTSYRDADIRAWVDQLDAGDSQIVVFLARQGLGVSRRQFDDVLESLTGQWEAIGVTPIITQDYADAAQALLELPHAGSPGYKAPQERASELWLKCVADFSNLQTEHSELLERDQADLSTIMGVAGSMVLWLSDAMGHAVRWSAPDRLYKNADQLRRVPVGFDSPWIVGQCLALNDVLGENVNERSDDIRRWQYVFAVPIAVERGGGPAFTFAALTLALDFIPTPGEREQWLDQLQLLSGEWTDRLARP